MEFIKSIEALNTLDHNSLDKDINDSKNKDIVLDKYISLLFGLAKECKSEELYMVISNDNKPLEIFSENVIDSFCNLGKDIYGTFYLNPIKPFVNHGYVIGDKVNLLTFRKNSSVNPKSFLLDGPEADSPIFDILSKEGLTEIGKENYLKICNHVYSVLCGYSLRKAAFKEVCKAFSSDNSCLYSFGKETDERLISVIDSFLSYYSCTSIIYCEIKDLPEDGNIVRISPIMHSVNQMDINERIEYEDFGEVGSFSFELDDYK